MFMENIIYESVYKTIYESGFNKTNALPYDLVMNNLKTTILSEMSKRDWKPTELARVSKVPQPTIQRYLSGTHGEPRSSTIKKIAAAFGMTELQLRAGGCTDSEVIRYHEIPKEIEAIPLSNAQKKLNEDLNVLLTTDIEPMDMVMLQQMIGMMAEKYKDQTPEKNQQNENKPLTSPAQNAGGGGVNLNPSSLQQSQDQRVKQSEFYAMVGAVCDKTNW